MKERLEDITGEAEAERLIRTEYLDEASMYRLDERIERAGHLEANQQRWESALYATERMTSAASGQTRRLRSLNEEVKLLRIFIRNLNKLLTAIMEGSIEVGQDAFSNFLIEKIVGLVSVSEEQKAILEIYVRLAYGGSEPALNILFPFAKKHNLFFGAVTLLETIARGEYASRWRNLMEKSNADYEEYVKARRENKEGTEWALSPLKEKLEDMIQWRTTIHNDFISGIDDDENYGKKWRRELAPAPFPVRIDQTNKDKVIRACINELEGGGDRALHIVQDLVGLCTLLADPENCIKVKSGQYTEREVNSRTEQDMIGERARELMALPKYTVYVKKLDSEHGTKIYKTTTRTLPDITTDMSDEIRRMIEYTRRLVCRLRRDIQDEIYNRQMPVIEDSEPPSPYD